MQKLEVTNLPTKYGDFQMIAYESRFKDFPHIVLRTPQLEKKEIHNVRIHSECMTGDLFSSNRCDCGEQLDFSLDYISKHQGIVIYLRQEGRGIGMVNKMKAYNLQDQGLDTFEANLKLGFHQDERNFDIAIAILKDLEVSKVNLITNNPEKIAVFKDSGIEFFKRIPVEIQPNDQNEVYLRAKKTQKGHLLSNLV